MKKSKTNPNAVFAELTWFAPRKCFKRKYKGKVYYLKGDGSKKPTEGNYEASLAEFLSLKNGNAATAPQSVATPVSSEKSLFEAISAYVGEYEANALAGEISTARWERVSQYLKRLENFAGDINCSTISEATLSSYRFELLRQKSKNEISSWTARYSLQEACSFTKWAWRQRYINELPRNLEDLTISAERKEVVCLSADEVKKLLSSCSTNWQRCLILLGLNTGMNQADISQIKASDYESGWIFKSREKTGVAGAWGLWELTKTFVEICRTDKQPSDLLFTTKNGLPLVEDGFRKGKRYKNDAVRLVWNRLAKKAGITGGYMQLRKTGASTLELLGYADCVESYLAHAKRSVASVHYLTEEAKRQAAMKNESLKNGLKALAEHFGLA